MCINIINYVLYGMLLVIDLCFAFFLGWVGPHTVEKQYSSLFALIRFARESGKQVLCFCVSSYEMIYIGHFM